MERNKVVVAKVVRADVEGAGVAVLGVDRASVLGAGVYRSQSSGSQGC